MANGTNKGGKARGDKVEIRTSACLVCGETVTNRKSFAISGGRICKAHTFSARQMGLWQAQKRMGKPLTLVDEAVAQVA
jgi:hypothetical protein